LFYTPANLAIGIQGKSRMGKSSIAAKLLADGEDWRFIGDDPTIFGFDRDESVVFVDRKQLLGSDGKRNLGGNDTIMHRNPEKDRKNNLRKKGVIVKLPANKIWVPSEGRTNLSYVVNLHERDDTYSERPYDEDSYLRNELDIENDSFYHNVREFKEALYAGQIPIIDIGIKNRTLDQSIKVIEESLHRSGPSGK